MKNSIGMEFVHIRPGSFLMGSPESEPGRIIDEEEHLVTITKSFAMQNTAVTLEQWRTFIEATKYKTEAEEDGGAWCHVRWGFMWFNIMNGWRLPYLPDWGWKMLPDSHWDNPYFEQSNAHPVTCISWNDAQEFTHWLSQKEHKEYRLPTEAEWEYACRAGTRTAYSFGPEISREQANYSRKAISDTIRNFSSTRTVGVKCFPPNSWGIYGMHGNVWEWCLDKCYGRDAMVTTDTYNRNAQDPLCHKGRCRILRGGSWAYNNHICRSAFRRSWAPKNRASGVGFRTVLVL